MTDGPRSIVERLVAAHGAAASDGLVVELAVGRRTDVALSLAERGLDVVATDVRERTVPEPVAFVVDDLTAPDESVYRGAGLLYARNLPAELQRPAARVAASVGAPLWFTTLGAEEPVVPVERETVAEGTLYRARTGPGVE